MEKIPFRCFQIGVARCSRRISSNQALGTRSQTSWETCFSALGNVMGSNREMGGFFWPSNGREVILGRNTLWLHGRNMEFTQKLMLWRLVSFGELVSFGCVLFSRFYRQYIHDAYKSSSINLRGFEYVLCLYRVYRHLFSFALLIYSALYVPILQQLCQVYSSVIWVPN